MIRLNEKIMGVLVQSALVGAPKKHDQIYTDSHVGSRRISSILKKIQPIGPQPTYPPPSIDKHKLTSIIDDMEPSGGRATEGIGTNSGHSSGGRAIMIKE